MLNFTTNATLEAAKAAVEETAKKIVHDATSQTVKEAAKAIVESATQAAAQEAAKEVVQGVAQAAAQEAPKVVAQAAAQGTTATAAQTVVQETAKEAAQAAATTSTLETIKAGAQSGLNTLKEQALATRDTLARQNPYLLAGSALATAATLAVSVDYTCNKGRATRAVASGVKGALTYAYNRLPSMPALRNPFAKKAATTAPVAANGNGQHAGEVAGEQQADTETPKRRSAKI